MARHAFRFPWKRLLGALSIAGWIAAGGCGSDHFTSQPLTCNNGQTACGTICVDTSSDPDHCGGCDKACQPGQVCSQGACALSCGGGTTKCGGSCIDTQLDPHNCGTCGKVCQTGEVCSAGVCATSCAAGLSECGGDGGAYCVNTQTDNTNCGSCGTTCASGQVCSGGKCATSCGAGLTECGGDGGPAYCANTQTDNANCGSCGTTCASGQVCSAGACTTTCAAGLTKCGGDGGPSYCANTQTDNANCGSCGATCANGQVCSGGACATSCGGGLTKCGGDGGPSYCANTQTDNANCGGCGTTCGAGRTCSAGNCVVTCASGQIACGGTCIDPLTNGSYCGATDGCGAGGGSAGTACDPGKVCLAGKCVAETDLTSYIFTGGLDAGLSTPRDEDFVLVGTPLLPGPADIYYTTDGSTPAPGAGGTHHATSPVAVTAGSSDTVIQWYADYGAPYGREPVTHVFNVAHTTTHDHGAIVENFQFGNGLPAIVVAPGTSLAASFKYQAWHSDPSGYCYLCVDYFFVGLGGVNQQLQCDFVPATAVYPGIQVANKTLDFTAPASPGLYFVRGGISLQTSCPSALNHIADVPPIGVIIVK